MMALTTNSTEAISVPSALRRETRKKCQFETRFTHSNAVADAAVLRGQIYRCCNKLDEAQAVLRDYVNKYPTHGHIQEVENLLAVMEAETQGK